MNLLARRDFLASTLSGGVVALTSFARGAEDAAAEPIIDIHQHTNYAGRTDAQLIRHQQILGVTTTVLLPAGRFYGLDAKCGGNESVVALARQHPDRFVRFAKLRRLRA